MPFISTEYQGYSIDGINWACLAEFEFIALNRHFKIPLGATTDGPSIPKVLNLIIPEDQWKKIWLPAVCHDAAYRFQLEENIGGHWIKVGLIQKECDELILELMLNNGVELILAKSIYEALRIFGWKAFHNDRDEHNL